MLNAGRSARRASGCVIQNSPDALTFNDAFLNLNDQRLSIRLGSIHYRQPLDTSMSTSALLAGAPRHGPSRFQVHPSP